ncbi:MAG: thiamine-phosphate kinase [candidate division Zixibacteria bacterium]|nr:thiamine-phosphate kinase [candidate division Zixibacteria bacterium]
MELKEIGEFGLIELIKNKIAVKDKRVIVNIGDDAAILKSSANKVLIFTTDSLMEKVHFDLKYSSFEDAGWKSMAANLSDIAAVGGIPVAGLVSLGIPEKTKAENILKLYSGIKKLSSEFNCPIVGGDLFTSAGGLVITISLLGEVEKKLYKTRAGAKTGDLIYVTGDLGGSEFGLKYLKRCSGKRRMVITRSVITEKHLTPYPRIKEARFLVKNLKLTSMIDISDGLSSDLYHICEGSQKGALIYADKIPINSNIIKGCKLLNLSPLNTALSSGEEYELLFTLNPEEEKKLEKVSHGKFRVSMIGEIREEKAGVRIKSKDGRVRVLKKTGYIHF